MAKEIFDYSKTNPSDYVYYGFHLKDGRYHIDTKRLIKLGIDKSFPMGLFSKPRNTHYFIPRYRKYGDYAINVLREQLNRLTSDWNTEYKTVIHKIMTPKEVMDNFRLHEIAYTSDVDDLDDIAFESLRAGVKRENKYNEVIKSIHLQYLQKIFAEFFRAILLVISDRGYKNDQDFKIKDLVYYVQNMSNAESKRTNPLYQLPHFRYFDVLNKIDNFLKHNTVTAYNSLANNPFEKDERLKKFQSQFVYSKKEAGFAYENGMYSGNWLKIGPSFVDETLKNLQEFAKEFCELLYEEDSDEAYWNSDESLIQILREKYFDIV